MQLTSKLLVALFFLGPAVALGQQTPEPTPAPVRRDLRIRMDLGGTEPGTSKQAFEGVLAYRGIQPWEFQAGYTYSDNVYFVSNRGYLTAYRFYDDGMSYVKADATLRKYDYPAVGSAPPSPDSNSYDWVPRGELEISHRFSSVVRGGLQYQLFPANFVHDTSSWTVNNKLSAEVELRPVSFFSLGGRAALLRDPDPDQTLIKGRGSPSLPAGTTAQATNVVYRTTSLIGGWAAVEVGRVGAKVEYLPNRDLDNSYAWSLLSTLDVRITDKLAVRLQQVHDSYASVSRFNGRTADIAMGEVGYAMSDALRLRAGYRYVDVPDRWDGVIIAGFELRPGY
ncbi:MAG TPA: hypothetical protein VFK90_16830 [Anaeromyxobacter sp.]|nr:hypothetical protein [Anaeromyxobacter sp.]